MRDEQEEFDWFCDLLSAAAEGPAAGSMIRGFSESDEQQQGDLTTDTKRIESYDIWELYTTRIGLQFGDRMECTTSSMVLRCV